MAIRIHGYLVEEKLAIALKAIVGEAAWRGREVRINSTRLRWDMAFEDHHGLVAVEFDGDEHYRHTLKIKADREKNELAERAGWRVVRFPYWFQLTSETLHHYFGLDAEIIQDFPHGFITTKVFPASFCELGVERFKRELSSIPRLIRDAVIQSLSARVRDHGREYVLPSQLTGLLPAPNPELPTQN